MANTLYDALFAPHAESTRVLMTSPGETLTHAQFADMAGRVAGALLDIGVTTGDRVAMQVEKSPMALAVYAACLRIGAVLLPLNSGYTQAEVAYFLGDATPKVLVGDPAFAPDLLEVATAHGARFLTLDATGAGTLPDLCADAAIPAVSPAGPDELAAILYTSGTTGRSKGAMLTHRNLLSNAETLATLWHFTDRDILIHALPIFHTHGLFVAVNTCLLAGTRMVFMPRFDLEAIIAAMPTATTMMGVPTFYTRLLADPRLDKDLTANMRLFISGSAPLLAETHRAFEDRTGHRILERYGMTETSMITSNPYDGERRPGTVGFPLPGVDVAVTEPASGAALRQGEIGMVEVRGPNVFKGYWQMPEKTAAEKRPDGYFITGDLGRFDHDGYLHIVGRQKDLIISGGFNVYPKEVETALDSVDGIAESAVIGVPHPDLGEAVVAVVVPRTGHAIDAEQLTPAIAANLARFKQPKHVAVLDALPRNTMGKVQKNILREKFAKLFC